MINESSLTGEFVVAGLSVEDLAVANALAIAASSIVRAFKISRALVPQFLLGLASARALGIAEEPNVAVFVTSAGLV